MKKILIVFIVLALLIGSVSAAIDAKQEKQSEPYNAEYTGDMLLQNWIAHYLEYITLDSNELSDNYIWTQEWAKPDSITFDVPEYVEYTYVGVLYKGVVMPKKVLVYVLNNYNEDMKGKTITANMSWTKTEESVFKTRSTDTTDMGAYVRLEFQDVMGGDYDSNNYWWSTGTHYLDLNLVTEGVLSVSLDECGNWLNQDRRSACNTTPEWYDWAGNFIEESPAEGFANAVKNVKQVGVSFGRTGGYASGIAVYGVTGAEKGTFTINSYTITG